jgi:hypothetical protein
MIMSGGVRLRRVTPWPYNDRPSDFSLPDFGLSPKDQQRLADDAWRCLVKGEDDPDDFVEMLLEHEFPLGELQIRTAFDLALEARLAQQAQWTDEETTTNLDRAFEELYETGVFAAQNFSCCMSCGSSEIYEEAEEEDDSREWRGYVFFHEQDTDHLLDSGLLYLAYGTFADEGDDGEPVDDDDDLRRLVETDILPVLSRHGLRPEWDGDLDTRILINNAQWYMPLPEQV